MKFCRECNSVMSKTTTLHGAIIFQCPCQLQEPGQPDDSLMAEGLFENTGSDHKHMIFIENSPFDPAANIVLKDCLNCGLNFLTLIRIGQNETTFYTCTCGFQMMSNEYKRQVALATKK